MVGIVARLFTGPDIALLSGWMLFFEEVEIPMKPWTQMALALGLAVSITACGGDRTATDDTRATGTGTGATVGTTGVGSADRSFIQDQIELNEAEVTIGRLAQERAANPQVREFAQTMVRDHEAAVRELRQIATQHNVEIERRDEMARDHRNVHERMMERKGAEFDREFIDWAVDKHESAINDLEGKMDSENQAVRQWASQTAPKLRQHLTNAQNLQQTLNKGQAAPRR
jgi:putative membrane protein